MDTRYAALITALGFAAILGTFAAQYRAESKTPVQAPAPTGVPAGTPVEKRFTGTLKITADNTVIDGWEITGNIVVEAKNVTIKNTKLLANTYHGIDILDDSTGFTLVDSEVDGQGVTDNCVLGFGTFLRNDVHGADHGLQIWGPSVVRGNYIHDLTSDNADPHFDGIFIGRGHEIEIVGNTIVNHHDQTAAIMMQNSAGSLSRITIDGNVLVGGGYTVYLDARHSDSPIDDASVRITNNRMGRGTFGYVSFDLTRPQFSGNVDFSTGAALGAP
ncbi:MAG TPA: hypothetical protein VNS34_27910 [Rhizobiaceae bacterium]|nr:hypothetical protein [Rhizobiaceae bacterium]